MYVNKPRTLRMVRLWTKYNDTYSRGYLKEFAATSGTDAEEGKDLLDIFRFMKSPCDPEKSDLKFI